MFAGRDCAEAEMVPAFITVPAPSTTWTPIQFDVMTPPALSVTTPPSANSTPAESKVVSVDWNTREAEMLPAFTTVPGPLPTMTP